MKILSITTHYPFSSMTGNSIIAKNHLKYLSKNNQVKLVCFEPDKRVTESEKFLDSIELIKKEKQNKTVKYFNYFFNILRGVPTIVSSQYSRGMKDKIRECLEADRYDVILLFEMSTIQFCPRKFFNIAVVNVEDPQSLKLERLSRLKIYSLNQRVKFRLTSYITKIYENRILPKIGKIILLSNQDILDFNKNNKYKNIEYVPYGVSADVAYDHVGFDERKDEIIFSGNMYYPPNVDGALFFIKNVFPKILKENSMIKLLIVGADPDKRIVYESEKLENNIIVTGRVDDINKYIKSSKISICPIRLKIGAQTKILEALSLGTPVVTTDIGNSGINGIDGKNLLIAQNPDEFSKKILELMDRDLWEKISKSGRELAMNSFSWENSGLMLEACINKLKNNVKK